MQLTYHTDYALRVLMYLAVTDQPMANVAEIAERYDISRNHLVKVVHNLARGGFIRTYRGKGGGIELARPPEQINIGSVVRYTEGRFKPVECFDASRNRCLITGACGLVEALEEACESFLTVLDRYSLANLVRRRTSLARLLAPRSSLN
ncbi:MAG TPA: Rrf2 family transcriptional regulator [Candidatus Binataceae bacterium]|nr:Rrf2 family transcriptional regulator [Candidatus Binataceae bacterium]